MELTEADFFAAEREADRIAAFCVHGQGHQNIEWTEPEPETGHAGGGECTDCGTVFPFHGGRSRA